MSDARGVDAGGPDDAARAVTLDGSRRSRLSIERGLRHVRAEQTNHLAEIMATVSADPYFPLVDHDGQGGTILQLLTDTESVERYYAARHGSYEIVESRQIAAVTADFYTFRESVATLRPVGDVGGVRGDGSLFQVNSAVLFPTGEDGIGGELVWTRFPFGDIVAERVKRPAPLAGPEHLPNDRLRSADAHDAYLDAWRRGDVDAMAADLAPDCRWQRRVRGLDHTRLISASGRDETRSALSSVGAHRPPTVVDVLNRVVTEWYVFCDLYLELELEAVDGGHDQVTARHIALHPVDDDGRLRGELGDMVVLGTGEQPPGT